MKETVTGEVRSILSNLFLIDTEELSPDSSPDTVGAWDSLQHLNLVLDVEQKFNINLSPAEIEAMLSVHDIVDIVNKKTENL